MSVIVGNGKAEQKPNKEPKEKKAPAKKETK